MNAGGWFGILRAAAMDATVAALPNPGLTGNWPFTAVDQAATLSLDGHGGGRSDNLAMRFRVVGQRPWIENTGSAFGRTRGVRSNQLLVQVNRIAGVLVLCFHELQQADLVGRPAAGARAAFPPAPNWRMCRSDVRRRI